MTCQSLRLALKNMFHIKPCHNNVCTFILGMGQPMGGARGSMPPMPMSGPPSSMGGFQPPGMMRPPQNMMGQGGYR